MSAEKNRAEALLWLRTAREDLQTAEVLFTANRHAHACFHAQQAGEKAVKSLWYLHAIDPWGHSIRKLLEDGRAAVPVVFEGMADLIETAAKLDRYYIPTRYPNGLPDIAPDDAFFRDDAEAAIKLSRAIVDRVTRILDR